MTEPSSLPSSVLARALWTTAPGRAELRPATIAAPGDGFVRVRALASGISRGTESLVFYGRVPDSEWDRMRAPFQEGSFPFPVKYGYAMVGQIEDGPAERIGERIFCLYPHQDRFNVPAEAALPVPDSVPTERAVLAPQMETALNATWDAAPRIGDRISIVGGGTIGCLVAYLCARMPGVSVTLIDTDASRAKVAAELGFGFATPDAPLPADCDLVFHASGSPAGLDQAIALAGFEATIVELSWFGDRPAAIGLGGAFHSRRLTVMASQVGHVAPARRPRWDTRRRLALALTLCADPALDVLVREETPFEDIAARLGSILEQPGALCHRIRYASPSSKAETGPR